MVFFRFSKIHNSVESRPIWIIFLYCMQNLEENHIYFLQTSKKFLRKVGDAVKVGNVGEKLEMYDHFDPLFCSDNGIFYRN